MNNGNKMLKTGPRFENGGPVFTAKKLAEFAARRLRIVFHPFFAAACTSRKILCAERVCFRAFYA